MKTLPDKLADECHGYDLDGYPVITGNFVLDGEPIDIGEFLRDNAELGPHEIEQIRSLKVGESMYLGGGAAPIFVLGREHDDLRRG